MKTRRTLISVVVALSILAQTAESVFACEEGPTPFPAPTEEVTPEVTEVQIDPAPTATDESTSIPILEETPTPEVVLTEVTPEVTEVQIIDPAPTATDEPTSTTIPETTPTPEVILTEVVLEEPSVPPPGCTIKANVNNEGWVEATVEYWGGPQGPGLWWVLRVRPNGREYQEWTGWENLSSGSKSVAETFATQVDLRVDFLGIQEGVCEGSFNAPPSAPPPPPTAVPVPPIPSPENTHQESPDRAPDPKPLFVQIEGAQSPNRQLEVVSLNGQLGVRDANGQIVPIEGASGENPLWLTDWTILANHADGSLFLTDRLATFTRELGVSGQVVSISGNGEWLKITGDKSPQIVSIHGMRYGLGDADSPVFAQIAFPGT